MPEEASRVSVLAGSKGDRTRKRIISAAREVFARDGYFQTRMSDVAQAADLSQGAIYRYFRDKDDLFLKVFEEHLERLYASTRAGRPFDGDHYEAFYQAHLGYFSAYSEDDLARAIYQAAAVDERYQKLLNDMRAHFRQRVEHVLERAEGTPPDRKTDLLILALQCATEYVAFTSFAESGGQRLDPPVTVPELAAVVANLWRVALDFQLASAPADVPAVVENRVNGNERAD